MNYEIFTNLPPQIGTFLIAMLPIGELRAAIPFALTVYKMGILESFIWAVAGNMFPVLFLLIGLEKASNYLMAKSPSANNFFSWLFKKTRNKFIASHEKWGELALIIFVAIPLPMTGAWTGSVAAYIFGIPRKNAFLNILWGVMIAGIIVTILTRGIVHIFQ